MQPFVTRRIPLSYGSLQALLDVEPWSADATELRLAPRSPRFYRWGLTRRRRWFRRAHDLADLLAHHLTTKGDAMAARIGYITMDTNDLAKAADFWSAVTGYAVTSNDGAYALLEPAEGAGPGIGIQVVPEARPKAKNRLHLDVVADDLDAEVSRIGDLGAAEVRRHEDGGNRWAVMTDTDGNEFCIVAA